MDKEFERTGTTFARYADDYVVLCDTEAEAQAALGLMTEFLEGVLRLALKPAKTQYCRVTDGFTFLGFRIGAPDVRIAPDKVTRAGEAAGMLVDLIAAPRSTSMEKCRALMRMNSLIRGFRNYFLIDEAHAIQAQLGELDRALDTLASQRLAADHTIDLTWAVRERFLPATIDSKRRK